MYIHAYISLHICVLPAYGHGGFLLSNATHWSHYRGCLLGPTGRENKWGPPAKAQSRRDEGKILRAMHPYAYGNVENRTTGRYLAMASRTAPYPKGT